MNKVKLILIASATALCAGTGTAALATATPPSNLVTVCSPLLTATDADFQSQDLSSTAAPTTATTLDQCVTFNVCSQLSSTTTFGGVTGNVNCGGVLQERDFQANFASMNALLNASSGSTSLPTPSTNSSTSTQAPAPTQDKAVTPPSTIDTQTKPKSSPQIHWF